MTQTFICKRLKASIIISALLLFSTCLPAQQNSMQMHKPNKPDWVDSVFNSLSLEERIAQLIFVRANNPNSDYMNSVTRYIRKYNIGGITFFGSTPYAQAHITNFWQSISKTPLMISIDAEWGLGMRLDSTPSFPFQMTLGAIQNDSLIYLMGKEIGRQCNRMGIHMNFAPVVDVNNNPLNPVINFRSFGEIPENVYKKGLAYIRGHSSRNVLSSAKHFPGHGDTDTDSHHSLPLIAHDKDRLDSVELYPFRKLIEKNAVPAIMVAHLYIPALEKEKDLPSTLSSGIINNLLVKQMGFGGLVITDGLEMKGVTQNHQAGEIELKALLAGNDILLLPQDVPITIKKIKKAIEKGLLSDTLINKKCKKLLAFKYDAGLSDQNQLDLHNIYQDLNTAYTDYLTDELYKAAITLVKNENNLIPVQIDDTTDLAVLVFGNGKNNTFEKSVKKYANADFFYTSNKLDKSEEDTLIKKLAPYDLILAAVQNTSTRPSKEFGIGAGTRNAILEIAKEKNLILNLFANPYALALFDSTDRIESILLSYQDNDKVYQTSAQALFGGIAINGSLPVSAGERFPAGTGLQSPKTRLEYTSPLAFGIAGEAIQKMDSIALSGIHKKAYPGCQVLAAKDGKIFYHKSFGTHTYDSIHPVRNSDIYDLASVTKIAATTLSVMKLQDEGKIDIDQRLQHYLPYLRGTDKGAIVIRDLMAHQAGLQAWIPYYKFTLDENGNPDSLTYSKQISEDYPIRVAENFYIRNDYKYSIFDSIIFSPPRENFEYKYSDLGFYILSELVELITNKPFEVYVEETFYSPMGLNRTSFLPRNRFEVQEIVPTEDDKIFRNQLLRGDVHDPGAAMLGGVSGHAGLFANANDLGKLLFMLLNDGQYGGKEYINKKVIEEFTRCQDPLNLNRRGMGFDKPMLEFVEHGPSCKSASMLSFGHSGFTGTYVWADPHNELIYIFLSNRVHPDGNNSKLMELDIRTNLHQAIYEALDQETKR